MCACHHMADAEASALHAACAQTCACPRMFWGATQIRGHMSNHADNSPRASLRACIMYTSTTFVRQQLGLNISWACQQLTTCQPSYC